MNDLLRFDGGRSRDPEIDAFFADPDDELVAMAHGWFERMRACGDDVLEVMHDGYPTVLVQDAPFAYVGVFSAHVNVGFFRGAEPEDPAGLLSGTGKSMRHVKLRPGVDVDADALARLIEVAYADMVMRVE